MKPVNCTEDQRKLANYITSALIGHQLSLNDLDKATKIIKRVYRTDGIIKGSIDHIKPLDMEN